MNNRWFSFLPLVIFLALLAGVWYAMWQPVVPTSTPTEEKIPATVVAAVTSTATVTAPPATSTRLPSPTPTPVPPTSTDAPPLTPTPIPTATFTPSPTDTPAATQTPTVVPTPTLIPTPTATPPDAVVVATSGLNLRSGPGTIYDIITSLRNGDILDVLGRILSDDWIQVRSVNPGVVGWVRATPELVQVNINLDTIPIITPPPPPTPTANNTPTPTTTFTATCMLEGPPTLLEPPNNTVSANNRLGLRWYFYRNLDFSKNEFFRVEIWHEGNIIDVAWTRDTLYEYEAVEGKRYGRFAWRITVIQGIPAKPKQWSNENNKVWEGEPDREVSCPSEVWTLIVENRPTPRPDRHDDPCSGDLCN